MLVFTLSVNAIAQTHNWMRTNPGGGGAFNVIEAGPSGTILAGSDLSGVYKSTDNGISFSPIGSKNGLDVAHIGSIGFDPNDADIFYLGTVNGLFKSSDHGEHFVKAYPTGYVSDVAVSKQNSNYAYFARHQNETTLDGEVYRSIDGGLNFTQVSNLSNDIRIIKMILDPNDASTLYLITGKARSACSQARLLRSTDAGQNFNEIGASLGQILDMALDLNNPDVLYATSLNASCDSQYYYTDREGSFYKSSDQGDTWELQSFRTGAIFPSYEPGRIRLIDPRNTATWNPTSGTWESIDEGKSWIQTGFVENWDTGYQNDVTRSYWTSFEGIIKGMGRDMSNPDVILWANIQWAFRSADGGKTFQNLFTRELVSNGWQSRGLDNINIMDMAISPVNPDVLFAGFFDKGFWRSLDGGSTWQSGNSAEYTGNWAGFGGNTATVLPDPNRENVVWATMSGNQLGQSPTYLLKSTDRGEKNSWVLSNNGLPSNELMGLSIDKNSSMNLRTLYVTAGGYVYKSMDDGMNWTRLTRGLPSNGGMRFTAVDNFDGTIVYAGGGNGLYVSTDAGDSWSNIGNTEMNSGGSLEFWPQTRGQGIFDIVPSMQNSGELYVTVYGFGKGLYKGKKTGTNWLWAKLYTDDYMRKVALHPTLSNIVYASSSSAFTDGYYHPNSSGIIYSEDDFHTATMVNEGTQWPFAMTINTTETDVYVGVPGLGIQKSQIPNVVSHQENTSIKAGTIRVSPNPSTGILRLEMDESDLRERKLKIFNKYGLLVDEAIVYEGSQIDVSHLSKGIYLLKMDNVYSVKFIKI